MALPRAVIYCRCSTEEESQADALRNQVLESEACIREQGWVLADRYVELKSGTTTKGRTQYNRLFADLVSDKFDIIVIKSQDRLMRNVKDWYLFLDRMLSHGKRLFMYIDRKFYTTEDGLVTGIKAILAEEYSRELSRKINNAHRHRQKNGKKAMLTSRAFGFLKLPDGCVVIDEEEAKVVRAIYEYSAAGYGSRAIAGIFLEQGYVKGTGNPLTATGVGRIIRNPLYMGTMVMNKVHYDFERKRTVKVPREQWIYRAGAVPSIVDEDLWERANKAMTERSTKTVLGGRYPKGGRAGQYELSGKLVCSHCKKSYYRTWRREYGDKEGRIVEWKCSSYLEQGRKGSKKAQKGLAGGCDNIHVDEKAVFDILIQVSRDRYGFTRKETKGTADRAAALLGKALACMPDAGENEELEREVRRLEGQKDLLLTKFLEGVVSDKDYRKRDDELEQKISRLRQLEDRRIRTAGETQDLERRMEGIKNWLKNGGIDRAVAVGMLEEIREIQVHEWQLELCFNPSGTEEGITVWADYPFSPETVRGRYLDRRKIVEFLKREPGATAGKLAREMGRSPYMVRNRMEELIAAGYIRFNGRGGRGAWQVLKELPGKEDSIRDGGL